MKRLKSDDAGYNPFASNEIIPKQMLDVVERNVTRLGNRVYRLQREGISFVERRLDDNSRAAQELASCKSLPDVFAAQQKWFADMARAYAEEWARCGALITDMSDGGLESSPTRHSSARH